MDLITQAKLNKLVRWAEEPCVSLYQPAYRSAPESHGNPVHLKNLLKVAEEELVNQGVRSPEARKILAPAKEKVKDEQFWTHQSGGLAIFLSPGFSQMLRLPTEFADRAYVGDHFCMMPLLPLVQNNTRFHILAASQNTCRLLSADRFQCEELRVDGLPEDLQSALGWWHGERELNFHSHQAKPKTRGGDDTAIYHGHYEDDSDVEISRYLHEVDKALYQQLKHEHTPLVFAGTEELFAAYKEESFYPHLLGAAVLGNPDRRTPEQLREQAWVLIEPVIRDRQRELAAEFGDLTNTGHTTDDPSQVAIAARDGLVQRLIIDEHAFNGTAAAGVPEVQSVQLQAKPPEDTARQIDWVVTHVLRNSGEVLVTDSDGLPTDRKLAAILRAPRSAVASTAG